MIVSIQDVVLVEVANDVDILPGLKAEDSPTYAA